MLVSGSVLIRECCCQGEWFSGFVGVSLGGCQLVWVSGSIGAWECLYQGVLLS